MKMTKLLCFILIIFVIASCSKDTDKTVDNNILGSILYKEETNNTRAINELRLGDLYEYEFKINNVQNSWTHISIELYTKANDRPDIIGGFGTGEGLETTPTTVPLYILHLIDPHTNEHYFQGFVNGGSFYTEKIAPFENKDGEPLGIAIGNMMPTEPTEIVEGKEYILGYFLANKTLATYDVNIPEHLEAMINENEYTILFKLKMTKGE